MCNKQQTNESGFTLVEVLISLAIVALIVGPISFSLLSAIKMRISAEAVNQVTKTTERLMEDIKSELTTQIYNKQEIEGNRKKAKTVADIQGYEQCLLANSIATNRDKAYELEGFLKFSQEVKETSDTSADTASTINLQEAYDTDHYAYEVALWQVPDITFEDEKLLLTATQMNSATKLYTDSAYKWSVGKEYDTIVYPLSFQITSEMLKLFVDANQNYVPSPSPPPIKILDTKVIKVGKVNGNQSLEMPNATEGYVKLEASIIENGGKSQGYSIKISIQGNVDSSAYPLASTQINIEVDIRELIGDIEMLKTEAQSATTVNTKTLKFINDTNYDVVIRVTDNLPEDFYGSNTAEDIAKNKKVNEYVANKYTIVAKDNQNGKSTIVKKADIKPYENYIIAMIVREKKPVLGKPGKIIKKMIDVYSYDITTAQRR